MNKVESGVRVIHIPTCIAVVSTEERSQYLNKRKALKRLQAIMETMKKDTGAEQINVAWREHQRIVRGNPVRVYYGKEFQLVK